MDTVAH